MFTSIFQGHNHRSAATASSNNCLRGNPEFWFEIADAVVSESMQGLLLKAKTLWWPPGSNRL